MKIRTRSKVLSVVIVVALLSLCVTWGLYGRAEEKIQQTAQNRYDSYLLAVELRQSSDDLTRLVRTYVVTGEAAYEDQYFAVLDIRNGKKPRPQAYNRIYWDFVAADGKAPRPDGAAVALQDLMRQAGFTEQEFAKLKEAQANSDGLVNLEVEAMNAVKGIFKDPAGAYTQRAEPNRTLAVQLVHSKQYHLYKAQIMKPVDEFFQLLQARTDAELYAAQRMGALYQALMLASIITVVLGVLWLVVSLWRDILTPLLLLRDRMLALAANRTEDGDRLARRFGSRSDEIGEMARSVQVFQDNARQMDLMRQAQTEDHQARIRQSEQVERLTARFEQGVSTVLDGVVGASSRFEETASVLAANAEETSQQVARVVVATEETSAAVRTAAEAAELLSVSVRGIGEQVTGVSTLAHAASEDADLTNATVQELSETTVRIGHVVGLINEIASQTNLLALNATIEAARAGEAGKGFAVVANEVKNLAHQTARATGEISQQIKAVQVQTRNVVVAIGGIVTRIDEINGIYQTITAAVEEQAAASAQIRDAVTTVARGASMVSDGINAVRAVSQVTGDASQQMLTSAHDLGAESDRLREEVGAFLAAVRPAADAPR
ncbi:methyl-accepting chemotaxis protein [Novispirillum itersonii]|uniref:Methyl-accepting chemotaxis protein n=1 Tax=Novispirillum itersonii TaxID=189 RepID=A0A7W9ZI61_NOVIT|nr:HAMP domain-containing methyl-accepting chemotaxis protein [Novispirillum itersonii]MBB6211092.1 methyl-accepting chemotaxis protein [Novispirillum itersonii]